ncbi:unnamed protein product [marine sediment metagenome]|uniref:Uncharacterized protein n=1 Tax=marine sediment metagenome TaxID=412755 RepID=X1RRH7_9ZZZZ
MKAFKCDRCGQYYAMERRIPVIPIKEDDFTWLVQLKVKRPGSIRYSYGFTADICPACLRELFSKALATDFEKKEV